MIRKYASNRPFTHVLYAWTAIILIAPSAQAQTAAWKPDRAVTLVVPYAAGGGTDATARAVSRQLGVLWGQPVVVENLPGADGLIGTRRVMDARPDGYTLLLQVPSIVLTKYTPGLKGIDPLARLEPVTAVSQSPAAIVTDLIANNVNMAFTGITAAMRHHKAGILRILATLGKTRAGAAPVVNSPAEFAAQVRAESERLGALVKLYPFETYEVTSREPPISSICSTSGVPIARFRTVARRSGCRHVALVEKQRLAGAAAQQDSGNGSLFW